ncbi:MAG: ABC transporter ATP-binding protein [Polyangiaceae bacterium]
MSTPSKPPSTSAPTPQRGNEKKDAKSTVRDYHDESALGKAYDSRLVKRLWPFIAPHKGFIVLSLSILLTLAGLNLVRPLIMGNVAAKATAKDGSGLMRDAVILSLVVLASQTLTFLQTYTMQIAGARAMADLRLHIFRFFQRLSLRYFDRTPVGRLVTRASSDVDAVGELFASGVLNAVGDMVALLGIVTMMLILDPWLALISFASVPIVILVTNFVRRRSREAFRDIRAKTARLNAFLNEQVAGIAVVQAYAKEKATSTEFDEINRSYRDANQRSVLYEAILDAAIEMVSTVCIASILFWAGLNRVGNHAVSFPLLVTFTQYVKQFFEPVSLLAQRYTMLQSAMAGAERIFQLLDESDLEPGVDESLSKVPRETKNAVELRNVSFAYKEKSPVLHDVSLHVKKGERVALVGATGAGKSTIASLVLRLYEANKGTVEVLGRDVRSYDPIELRSQFAVVPQDVFLFAGTILSNITLTDEHEVQPGGSVGPDRKRAREVLERIGAGDLLERRGLDGLVEERGSNFSAGERQLLAFARAMYRDAPILILDEATASIDSNTEEKLQRAVGVVLEGRSAIVIAHRLSTIQSLDRIIVFHKGRVEEAGTHEELLRQGGVYAKLHRLHKAAQKAELMKEEALAAEAAPAR